MDTLSENALARAVANAKQCLALLRHKYPEFRGYLVLSLPGAQVALESTPAQILAEAPVLIADSPAKSEALDILARLRQLEWRIAATPRAGNLLTEKEQRSKRLAHLLGQLTYAGHGQIEIRFTELNYDLIAQLQADELVDRELTPQTRASIRIVLGTLGQSCDQPNKQTT